MAKVRRYLDLETDLNTLFKGVKSFLQTTNDLQIGPEITGTISGKPFMTVTATKKSVPRFLVGALREATVSITGDPNDFLVEVHTGSWFSNVAATGTAGILIAGPVGFAIGTGIPTILALEYERKLWNKIQELVEENSKKPVTIKDVEIF